MTHEIGGSALVIPGARDPGQLTFDVRADELGGQPLLRDPGICRRFPLLNAREAWTARPRGRTRVARRYAGAASCGIKRLRTETSSAFDTTAIGGSGGCEVRVVRPPGRRLTPSATAGGTPLRCIDIGDPLRRCGREPAVCVP